MRVAGIFWGLAVAVLVTGPVGAADMASPELCAVSGFNGKLQGQGGVWDADGADGSSLFQGVASLSMPLGCAIGLQVDGGAASYGDADAVGIGGHLFFRDPNSYLLGVHSTYESWSVDGGSDFDVWRVGAEAEAYLGNISLEAWGGVQDVDNSDAQFFGKVTAALYAADDLRLAVGLRQSDNFTSGALNAEWQMTDSPMALTAEAVFGEDDYMSLTGGVKFYFGGNQKSLIDRHRKDDPDDGLFDFAGSGSSTSTTTTTDCQNLQVEDPFCEP